MENTPQRRGLRILIGLAGLFSVFALAWLWQERNIEQSRRIRNSAPDLLAKANGEITPSEPKASPLAHLEPGWGRIVLGRPSGAEPTARPTQAAPAADADVPASEQPEPPASPTDETAYESAPVPSEWPADQELTVRPGQSLSKIIASAYDRSTPELVSKLATYNGMENADKLRVGQKLLIPSKDKLLELVP
ncbi:MAG: nucleoid-associated protein YgaU [Planctomycetota bacterium]